MIKKGKQETFEKRLKVYSVAAAGVLALAPSAEAAIHYSGIQNLPVSGSATQSIDLNNDSNTDFVFGYSNPPAPGYWNEVRSGPGGQGIIQGKTGATYASFHADPVRLPSNYLIGPSLANNAFLWDVATAYYQAQLNGLRYGAYAYSMGNFNNNTGYIGVRFQASCGTAYGWIQYQGGIGPVGTVIDWAYEDNCQPIRAGQTQSATIPTLNQWGIITLVLLLGGLAASMLRKEEKEES